MVAHADAAVFAAIAPDHRFGICHEVTSAWSSDYEYGRARLF
jgi:hypothetical protein